MCAGQTCLKGVGLGRLIFFFFWEGLRANQMPAHTPHPAPGFRTDKILPRAAMLPVCNPSSSVGNSHCHSHGAEWGSTHLRWPPCHRTPGENWEGGELEAPGGSQKPGLGQSEGHLTDRQHKTTRELGGQGHHTDPGPKPFFLHLSNEDADTFIFLCLRFSSAHWNCREN